METERSLDRFTKGCILAMLLGAVAVVVLSFFSGGLCGNDYWWHVKAGEWMVKNRQVLRQDVFSWTMRGHPWIAHEWLSEVCFYLLQAAFGDWGVFGFAAFSALLMVALMVASNRKKLYENVVFSMLYFILFGAVACIFFYGRPHVFSFFLLFAELACIYSFLRDKDSKRIYGIPFLACLWANLHGGSANLSYLLLLLLLVSALPVRKGFGRLEFLALKGREALRLAGVLLLTVLAICVNPFGLKLLWYPYEQMSDAFLTSAIVEWRAPDAKEMGNLVLFFFPIALCVLGMLLSEKKVRCFDLLILFFFLFLFFRSRRFIVLLDIASSFWAFDYVLPCRLKPITKRSERVLAVACLTLMIVLGAGYVGKRMVGLAREGTVIQQELSQGMLDLVKKEAPQALFNDYGLGGYLIYHDIPVFYDGRANDLYAADGIFRKGVALTLLNGEKGDVLVDVEETVEEYGIDAFLVQSACPLYHYLCSHEEAYERLLEEDGTAYFRVL